MTPREIDFRSSPGGKLVLQMAAYVAFVVVGARLLQQPFRGIEALLSVQFLHAIGVDRIYQAGSTAIGVIPTGSNPAFLALVTPACSCLSSLLALTALTHHMKAQRRTFALSVALLAIFCGNVLRIAASVLVGVASTRTGLVLFHDSVGSAFAFVYTIGGYCLVLYLLLPGTPRKGLVHQWNRTSSGSSLWEVC